MKTRLQTVWNLSQNHTKEEPIVILKAECSNFFLEPELEIPLYNRYCCCLRGVEINADVILKGTRVDGVYDCDLKNKLGSEIRFYFF
jgi:hypothetical protein